MALIPVTVNVNQFTANEVTFLAGFADLTHSQGDIWYANSSGQVARLTAGTDGFVLTTHGAGQNPTWTSVAGMGTVTTVSVVSANGFAGSVANASSTPAITLTTSITGLLKGNATAISAATAGTDYVVGSTGLAGGQTIAGGTLTTQVLTLRGNAADTTTGSVAITTSTASTTKTTGALTIAGGLGVVGAIFSNDLTVTNTITGSISGNANTSSSTTGNAATATKLAATKNIWGVAFDGSADISGSMTGVGNITGGASSMTIVAGTGASRTLIFQTTTAGSTATTALTLAADQSATFANTVNATTFVGALTGTASGNLVSGGALGTPSSGTLTSCTGLPIAGLVSSTSTALGVGSIELGHASDTTIARVSAGVISVEGVNVMTVGSTDTVTGVKTCNNIIDVNNAITASSNAATVPITYKLNTVTNNSAATLTITMTTTSAVDGQMHIVRILDASAVAQTITWVNTEDSTVTAPTTSNGSTTLFLTVGFIYNGGTSKWRCIAKA